MNITKAFCLSIALFGASNMQAITNSDFVIQQDNTKINNYQTDRIAERVDFPFAFVQFGLHVRKVAHPFAAFGIHVESIIRVDIDKIGRAHVSLTVGSFLSAFVRKKASVPAAVCCASCKYCSSPVSS